jgi:hypothetical protein
MLPQQKEAMYTLVVWIAGTVAMVAVAAFAGRYQTEITYGLLALTICSMWVFRRIAGVNWKTLDEMDQCIRFKAGMAGAAGVVLLIVVTCLVLSTAYRVQGVVPVCFFARMAFGAMAALYLFWTVAILILYRKGG